MVRIALVFWMTLQLSTNLWSQTESAKPEKEDEVVVARHKRMLDLAKGYAFSEVSGGKEVKLRETPLFSWTNPEVQSIGGELYLWTVDGRPFATIGIWTYDDIKDSHELQSLSTQIFRAENPYWTNWAPRAAGLQFKKLEDAPAPDASPVRRQTQMRNFVRERFSGEVIKNDTKQTEKLRVISQPLYRYDPLPTDLIDGAVFSLAFGTDPEILVILEAKKTEAGSEWQYALAPCTSRRATGYLDGKEVWNSDSQQQNGTFLFIINR
ncbi:MAG: hypothetical protein SFV81_27695 [Pirellulaceae bacterium]|nr:hypothetical protein [Pirellulaceae bacterium]